MLRFISFSSGSCGNCYYIGDGQKGLFVDAGISFKNVQPMLSNMASTSTVSTPYL